MNLQREHAQGARPGTGSRGARGSRASAAAGSSPHRKTDTELVGVFFSFFFFVSSPSWTADAGLKHAPSSPSPRFKGLQLPLQPPQQQQSLGVRKSLPSSPQRFCVSMPSGNGSEFSQSTYRKSQRLQLRGAEFSGLLEQVGVWMYAYGWLRGPGATAPVTGPCE